MRWRQTWEGRYSHKPKNAKEGCLLPGAAGDKEGSFPRSTQREHGPVTHTASWTRSVHFEGVYLGES